VAIAVNSHIAHGFGAVRPYIYCGMDTVTLVRDAFGAIELERVQSRNGLHIEAQIGDGVLVLEAADPPHPHGTPGSTYIYLQDVDRAYERALLAGATSVARPEDKPYRERSAGVKDAFGNVWWISTFTG
jgi:PhnB protein